MDHLYPHKISPPPPPPPSPSPFVDTAVGLGGVVCSRTADVRGGEGMGGERVKEEDESVVDKILRQESDRVSPRFLLEPSLSEERRRGREQHTLVQLRARRLWCFVCRDSVSPRGMLCKQEQEQEQKRQKQGERGERETKKMVTLFACNASLALLSVRVSNGDATGQTSNFVLFVATTLAAAALPGR